MLYAAILIRFTSSAADSFNYLMLVFLYSSIILVLFSVFKTDRTVLIFISIHIVILEVIFYFAIREFGNQSYWEDWKYKTNVSFFHKIFYFFLFIGCLYFSLLFVLSLAFEFIPLNKNYLLIHKYFDIVFIKEMILNLNLNIGMFYNWEVAYFLLTSVGSIVLFLEFYRTLKKK
jgi:hypothetical protein